MTRLLDAAVEVVAADGLRGLTHRAVDRRAGLPEGSCSAYLRTRFALLAALAEYAASRVTADTRELTGRLAAHDPDAIGGEEYAIDQTVAMFLGWLDHPELIRTRIELALEGDRQPELAAVSAAWSSQLVEIVENLMSSKGRPDAAHRAATLVAAMEGVLTRAMREEPARQRDFLGSSLDTLMRALAGAPG